jgi:ABC-type multidrug transport system permease subunit
MIVIRQIAISFVAIKEGTFFQPFNKLNRFVNVMLYVTALCIGVTSIQGIYAFMVNQGVYAQCMPSVGTVYFGGSGLAFCVKH